MKLLADENTKRRLVQSLVQQGHDIVYSGKGASDESLYTKALSEGRILLTNDTDFLNTALYPIEHTPGRIILRVFPPTLVNQIKGLEAVFSYLSEDQYGGTLVEVLNDRFEIRDVEH